jgi:hypothetical protein
LTENGRYVLIFASGVDVIADSRKIMGRGEEIITTRRR